MGGNRILPWRAKLTLRLSGPNAFLKGQTESRDIWRIKDHSRVTSPWTATTRSRKSLYSQHTTVIVGNVMKRKIVTISILARLTILTLPSLSNELADTF